MTQQSIAWLAGLLEGEGSFALRPGRTSRIAFDTTDRDIAERVAVFFQTKVNVRRNTPVGNKQVYCVRSPSGVTRRWMELIYPFMGERRQSRIRECLERWTAPSLPQGWTGHKAKHGCQCTSKTGSCQPAVAPVSSRVHPVEGWEAVE